MYMTSEMGQNRVLKAFVPLCFLVRPIQQSFPSQLTLCLILDQELSKDVASLL